MRVLFVVSEVTYSEPLGVMQLSAVLKRAGHQTRMTVLKGHSPLEHVKSFRPDLLAYSTMSPDIGLFRYHDARVRETLNGGRSSVPRIMGGPHPTFFPQVLQELDLDAICIGEGDHAILRIVERLERGSGLDRIPNVLTRGGRDFEREIVRDLDSLPFLDRDIFYQAVPVYRSVGIRSVLTSHGCPYHCTYCFNHAFNEMFKGVGPILRRRSVDSVLAELKLLVRDYQPVRLIRFGDDTFVFKADEWLKEFVERYRAEIGVPFYCLMRSNTLTDEVARMLAYAGCRSVGMSLESGSEEVRNKILKRNLSDAVVRESFAVARKYGLKTFGNSMLGIPGTTVADDFHTVAVSRELKISVPTFGMFSPYPRTHLTDFAVQKGLLDPGNSDFQPYRRKTVLKGYTEEEKNIMLRLAYLGTFFCFLPDVCQPLMRIFVRLPLTGVYALANSFFMSYLLSTRIFPGTRPRSLFSMARHAWMATRYWLMVKGNEEEPRAASS
jgi:anaerobic magnesium-protoporphyrin IX monomethyl ester cyclase